MFTNDEKKALIGSWRLVVPLADTLAELFYQRLFELRPEYRPLFPEDLSNQKRRLVRMLAFIVRSLDWTDEQWRDDVAPNEDLMLVVLAMGRRHAALYRIPDPSYGVFGEVLLWTLHYGLGEAFTPTVKNAWVRLYANLTSAMRMGGAVIEPAGDIVGADEAQRHGTFALLSQQAEAGIDDARPDLSSEGLS